MTTAEKTLKWWNDYKKINGTYPLIAEIEAQLQMAVDEEKLVKNCSISDVVGRSEQLNTDLENEVFNNNKDWVTNDDVDGSFLYELKTIAYGKGSSSERLEEIKEKLSSK